jgi:cytochrome c
LINRPAGTSLLAGDQAELLAEGERLWNDTGLSSNGMACVTCHVNNQSFMATFAEPYPHKVAMSSAMAGMSEIDLDEMVQLCLVVPMATSPLGWESKELAALTAYTAEAQKAYMATAAANPCAAKNPCNPCAATNPCNPCAANPCATKNPCAAKKPCAANPCVAKNPCSG